MAADCKRDYGRGVRLFHNRISDRLGPVSFETRSRSALFHASALEKSGIRRVLLDIGGITLLCRILDIVVHLRRILAYLGMVTSTLLAAIGGWHRRHFIVT
jgi:succinate dehydrogenase/fumarate reductase cytochrome b subunit